MKKIPIHNPRGSKNMHRAAPVDSDIIGKQARQPYATLDTLRSPLLPPALRHRRSYIPNPATNLVSHLDGIRKTRVCNKEGSSATGSHFSRLIGLLVTPGFGIATIFPCLIVSLDFFQRGRVWAVLPLIQKLSDFGPLEARQNLRLRPTRPRTNQLERTQGVSKH